MTLAFVMSNTVPDQMEWVLERLKFNPKSKLKILEHLDISSDDCALKKEGLV